METSSAVARLSALAQPSRLSIFRLLVKAGEAGLPAGEVARQLSVRPNTLSTNLAILNQAGLIRSQRDGRCILYRADFGTMRDLVEYLVADCCDGNPEICLPSDRLVLRVGPVADAARQLKEAL